MKRESSPPDAILESGPAGVLGLVLALKVTRSTPLALQSGSSRDCSSVAKPRGAEPQRPELAIHRPVETQRAAGPARR